MSSGKEYTYLHGNHYRTVDDTVEFPCQNIQVDNQASEHQVFPLQLVDLVQKMFSMLIIREFQVAMVSYRRR